MHIGRIYHAKDDVPISRDYFFKGIEFRQREDDGVTSVVKKAR